MLSRRKMTAFPHRNFLGQTVIPAQAGIQEISLVSWIPAYAGMT
jgi:hypothetical protein